MQYREHALISLCMAVCIHALVMYSRQRGPESLSSRADKREVSYTLIEYSSGFQLVIVLALVLVVASCIDQLRAYLKTSDIQLMSMYTYFLCFIGLSTYLAREEVGNRTEMDFVGFLSCALEGYGLISIFNQIQRDGNVIGVSGNSFIIYAVAYTLRQCDVLFRTKGGMTMRIIVVELQQVVSVPLVIIILWAIFKTHKTTYQKELDVVKAKPFLAACVVAPAVIRPSLWQGPLYSYWWSVSFYMDIFALLPQVVMTRNCPEANIAAPIARFVIATSISRAMDLYFWYLQFEMGAQAYWHTYWGKFNYSRWLIVILHVFSLVFSADFMYTYLRCRWLSYQNKAKDDKDDGKHRNKHDSKPRINKAQVLAFVD